MCTHVSGGKKYLKKEKEPQKHAYACTGSAKKENKKVNLRARSEKSFRL